MVLRDALRASRKRFREDGHALEACFRIFRKNPAYARGPRRYFAGFGSKFMNCQQVAPGGDCVVLANQSWKRIGSGAKKRYFPASAGVLRPASIVIFNACGPKAERIYVADFTLL